MSLLVPAALAALFSLAAPDLDTVMLRDGGRLRGTVVEETRAGGVTIQLPDGRVERVAPGEVQRVVYGDGAVGVLGGEPPASVPAPAAAAAPAAPAGEAPAAAPEPGVPPQAAVPPEAPPAVAPPPPPPPPFTPAPVRYAAPGAGRRLQPPSLFMLAGGLGVAVPFGDAYRGAPLSDFVEPLFLIDLEVGLRLTPAFMLGVVLDIGIGGAATEGTSLCRDGWGTSDCTGLSAQFALQARYTLAPFAPATPWVALGVGGEATGLAGPGDDDQFTFTGSQFPRLSAGYDFRTDRAAGWGIFGTLAFGRFDRVDEGGSEAVIANRAGHGWFMVGVRAILGP